MTAAFRHRLAFALKRLLKDRSGVGAVEFAMLVPILLMLYICAFEVTMGLSVAKRATRATGTIADIVTQNKKVTKTYLDTMPSVVDAIFPPYPVNNLTLKITGVTLDAAGLAKVAWSWQKNGNAPYAIGSLVSVPVDLQQANSFLVRIELGVTHDFLLFMARSLSMEPINGVPINRESFFRQRYGDTITCTGC